MIIKNVELETVCGITSKLPDNQLCEIAFAGKSNVGKSSLINGAKFHSVISSGRQSPCIVAPILQRLGELMLLNMLLCRKIISRKIQPLVSKLSTSVFRPEYASLVGTRKYII